MPLINPDAVVDGAAESAAKLLRGAHRIPAYQRDYVWQEKHVGQLWDDLFDHYERFVSGEELIKPEGYFVGAMVVIQNEIEKALEVVDGQQRLTTLSTIAAVLFDVIQEILPDDNPVRIGHEHTLRDMLGKFDNGAWKANLQFADEDLGKFFLASCLLKRNRSSKKDYWEEPWCVSRIEKRQSPISRLKAAIEVGYAKLLAFLDEQPELSLRRTRFLSFLVLATEAVVLLKITARSYGSAYAIFESLNNRSVPLSQADLIKNEMLKAAAPADRDDITDNWVYVRGSVETFDSVQLPDFLHYSFLSRYGRARARELYLKAKSQVESPAQAKVYVDELVQDVDALDALVENFRASWTADTTNMLKDIKGVLNVKLCYPFLIAAYRQYDGQPSLFEGHVRAVMNFAFRYVKVLEGSLETFANVISDAATQVNKQAPLTEITKGFRAYASDAEFAAEFARYETSSVKLAYFIVYYLERVQVTGVLPTLHGVEQNLEHIMPKRPSLKHWPVIRQLKDSSPDVFRSYLWRIGNLLPLPATINKSIKNREVSYKVNNSTGNHYNAAELGLISPKNVANYLVAGEWRYESIESRQKDLAEKYAAKAWSLA